MVGPARGAARAPAADAAPCPIAAPLPEKTRQGEIASIDVEDRNLAYALAIRFSELPDEERSAICPLFPNLPHSSELLDTLIGELEGFENNADEHIRLIRAIAEVPGEHNSHEEVFRIAELALSEDISEEYVYNLLVHTAAATREASEIVWDFVVEKEIDLRKKLKGVIAEDIGYNNLIMDVGASRGARGTAERPRPAPPGRGADAPPPAVPRRSRPRPRERAAGGLPRDLRGAAAEGAGSVAEAGGARQDAAQRGVGAGERRVLLLAPQRGPQPRVARRRREGSIVIGEETE